MEINTFLQNKIGIIRNDNNPSRDSGDIRHLVREGFNVLLTVADYDFNIMWRVGSPESIRHYWCTFGDYPKATRGELQHLNEFYLYEIWYDRKVALWCEDTQVEKAILQSIDGFFQLGKMTLPEFIQAKLESQPERAKRISKKLTHCKACLERCCITELMCHVTSVGEAEKILKDGKILSAAKARNKTGKKLALEARNAAGDPPDYFDYVMFTFGNCTAGDRLVMERALGRELVETELKDGFNPGVRFYFRYSDLVEHPGFCSDGYHYCKIKDSVTLDDYLVTVVAPDSARSIFEKATGTRFIGRLVFIDQNRFTDLLSWSQNVYNVAVRHKRKLRFNNRTDC